MTETFLLKPRRLRRGSLRNDARMPHCLRWGGMASLLGGLGDRFPQHDRDLPSKAPPLAAGIFTSPICASLYYIARAGHGVGACQHPRQWFCYRYRAAYNGSLSDLMAQFVERICDFIHNAFSIDYCIQ